MLVPGLVLAWSTLSLASPAGSIPGHFLWQLELPEAPVAIVWSEPDAIHVALRSGRIATVDATGRIRSLDDPFHDPPSSEPERVELAGIVLTSPGRVIASDRLGHRLLFAGEGQPSRPTWGGFGRAAGRLRRPAGLARSDDRLLIADAGNHRVQVLDAHHQPLFTIGAPGGAPGQLRSPRALALAPDGTILVADTGNHRIQLFGRAGEHLRSWGVWGPHPGQLSSPSGIDCDGARVYVADRDNHRIQVFDREGTLLGQWGRHVQRPREGQGALHYPDALAVSPDGSRVLVGEGFEDRLQLFGPYPEGEQPAAITPIPADPHFGSHCAVAGELLVLTEPEAGRLLVHDITNPEPILITTTGDHGEQIGQFLDPRGVTLHADRLWVADGLLGRWAEFRLDRPPGTPLRYDPFLPRLTRSVRLDRLDLPADERAPVPEVGVVAPDGRRFILDRINSRVLVLDVDWEFLAAWGRPGRGRGDFLDATDLCLDATGSRVLVVDRGQAQVLVFRPDGEPVGRWPAELELGRPFAIARTAEGRFVLTDEGRHQVSVHEEDGSLITRWGKPGLAAGEFRRPRGVAVAGDGRIFVVDHGNHRVQIFDSDGIYLRAFGARAWVRPAERTGAARVPPPEGGRR